VGGGFGDGGPPKLLLFWCRSSAIQWASSRRVFSGLTCKSMADAVSALAATLEIAISVSGPNADRLLENASIEL